MKEKRKIRRKLPKMSSIKWVSAILDFVAKRRLGRFIFSDTPKPILSFLSFFFTRLYLSLTLSRTEKRFFFFFYFFFFFFFFIQWRKVNCKTKTKFHKVEYVSFIVFICIQLAHYVTKHGRGKKKQRERPQVVTRNT